MSETRSTCPYCGVGCGVLIESDGTRITGVRGDPEHPANFGRLCTKGATLHLTASAPVTFQTRLSTPMRRPQRNAAPESVSWDDALDEAAARFATIIARDGPDAVGFYGSGQLLTEDYYVFNKLVKGLIGTNQFDTNSRLCMSSAVAGYKATLGADAPPACYEDLDHAGTVFVAGSNTAWAHPILFRRLEGARRAHPDQKLIVVDPRRTETADLADLHLPLLPGSDIALFHGMLHALLWEGLVDTAFIAAHTTGFDALRDRVREFTPRETARQTGLREDDIITAARWFGDASPTLSLYCQGLNQSVTGTARNAALINLHLATGQIGTPGAGPFSLTGQPNAMGGREVGGMANLLSAHRDLGNPQHRAEVAALWGVPDVPATPGRTAVEMFQAAADGAVKALWIACTNPAQSMPDQATVRRALQRCEFVVVQEAFATTATAAFADLLLPATSWGEKDGTVTNSERRISRVRAAVAAPGQARHDWAIAADFARRLARRIAPERERLFAYDTPESIWCEHRASTRGRDLDITGLSYALLETRGPQQWPFPDGADRGRTRLYEDHVFATPDGRARFADVAARPLAEPRDARHPFSLLTGRLRDQWHGMSRTGTLGRLFGHEGAPAVELHPHDMARLSVIEGDLMRVTSRRGTVVLPARASDTLSPAQAFVAMHWGEEALTGSDDLGRRIAGINDLTVPAFCPQSKQPELKHTAVRLERADLRWQLLAMRWLPEGEALAVRESLRALLGAFAYASCLPFGREPDARGRVGLVLRAAARASPDAATLGRLRALMRLDGPMVLAYDDARRGQQRALQTRHENGVERLDGFWVAGDTSGAGWLRDLLADDQPLPGPARQLLAPGALAMKSAAPRSPQVCTCFDISEARIDAALGHCTGTSESRLAQLQASLKCGTSCGSCLPALRARVQKVPTTEHT